MPRLISHGGAGWGSAAFQVSRKDVADFGAVVWGCANRSRISAKDRPLLIMKSMMVPLSLLSCVLKQTQCPLPRFPRTGFGCPSARNTGQLRVEALWSRTYPHCAAMSSKGLRLRASKSARGRSVPGMAQPPGVPVDGDDCRPVCQAVGGGGNLFFQLVNARCEK